MTEEKEKNLIRIIEIIKRNLDALNEQVKKEMFPLVNENITTLNPRKFHKLLDEEVTAFFDFIKQFKEKGLSLASKRGKIAAKEGLGESIILSFNTIFRIFIISHLPEDNDSIKEFTNEIVFSYIKSYLLAYLEERYIQIINDQEQLYESMIETISKQQEEIRDKERQLQQSKFKALEEQNRQRLDFLINFAHETKLPLSIILNSINMVKEEAGRRKLKSLPILENEIKELMDMVIDILDNEKILQGKMLYNHDVIVNVSSIVLAKIDTFRGIAKDKGILITSEIESNLYIRISTQALDRILNNILDNAIKYNAPKEGRIHISIEGKDDSVKVYILDTGIGIPADQLDNIFNPYYQSAQKKRNIQGIGAGLPLVKSILSEISGHIEIDSKVSKGTTVIITFIRETLKEGDKAAIIEEVHLSNPVKKRNISLKPEIFDENKRTILIVEDNVELLSFMQDQMDSIFNFYYARDGQEALRKLKTMPKPDVIISDIMMDIMDGYEFFGKVKDQEELQDIPFIFLSAKTTVDDKLKGLQYGAVDYIEKPFSIQVLKEKIKTIIYIRDIYIQKEVERMEQKIVNVLRTQDSAGLSYTMKFSKYKLTMREREIMYYVIKGMDNKVIAEELFISPETIKKHIQNIKEKCGVKNKLQLVNLFRR